MGGTKRFDRAAAQLTATFAMQHSVSRETEADERGDYHGAKCGVELGEWRKQRGWEPKSSRRQGHEALDEQGADKEFPLTFDSFLFCERCWAREHRVCFPTWDSPRQRDGWLSTRTSICLIWRSSICWRTRAV